RLNRKVLIDKLAHPAAIKRKKKRGPHKPAYTGEVQVALIKADRANGAGEGAGLTISDSLDSRGCAQARLRACVDYNKSWRRLGMGTRFYALVLIGMTAMAADPSTSSPVVTFN